MSMLSTDTYVPAPCRDACRHISRQAPEQLRPGLTEGAGVAGCSGEPGMKRGLQLL